MNYRPRTRLGILGGGQLGRMLIQEAIDLDIECHVLDPDPDAPCAGICHSFTVGQFRDHGPVMAFGADKDVITIEIEDVNVAALRQLEAQGKQVFPQPAVIDLIQDKGAQKEFYVRHGIPTAPFVLLDDAEGVRQHLRMLPAFQKLRRGGYDGKGVVGLGSAADLSAAFNAPSVLESRVEVRQEISVIVSRHRNGQVSTFPVVEMEFNPVANLVEFLFAPAAISVGQEKEATALAVKVADALGLIGILAVEMFIDTQGRILVNEVAPRPHNSGHHTIEANQTSQYMQHIRAIMGLAPGSTRSRSAAVMVNLLGEPGHAGPVRYEGLPEALALEGVNVHIYGKAETRPYRKMGHVTVTAPTLAEAKERAHIVKQQIRSVA
jgi:5-(carboxyamino)imidazole ribonucleotide synthase